MEQVKKESIRKTSFFFGNFKQYDYSTNCQSLNSTRNLNISEAAGAHLSLNDWTAC